MLTPIYIIVTLNITFIVEVCITSEVNSDAKNNFFIIADYIQVIVEI